MSPLRPTPPSDSNAAGQRLDAHLQLDRRDFLQTMAASLALAGLTGCSHPPQEQIVPYVHAPLGQIDGLPRFFATALTRNGYAHGVLVENHMGRPTKVEGNPHHPASLGGTDIFAQAAVLQLWDPDRSQAVMHREDVASWETFGAQWLKWAARLDQTQGAGLRVLTETITSPTLSSQLDSLRRRYPRAHWHVYQPVGQEHVIAGAKLAFEQPVASRLRLERAKVILSLDADFLSDPAAGVRYARDFISGRSADTRGNGMARLYVLEPTPSLTGAMADHRLPLQCAEIEIFVRHLAGRLGVLGAVPTALDAQQSLWLDEVTHDLQAHRGEGLITVGPGQAPWVHALGHALNSALGNVGATIEYSNPVETLPDESGSLADLVAAMHAGSVDTLLVLGANPVYDAPADLQFGTALEKVPHLVHLGLYRDETGARAEWHLPQAHSLETWSDARAFDGTATIVQPLIAPLYGGRSAHEMLSAVLGDGPQRGLEIVRRHWQETLDDTAWTAALQAGVVSDTAFPTRSPTLRPDAIERAIPPLMPAPAALELVLRPDPTVDDGRWANNGWLQELPKPLTKLTWENAALIAPKTAERLKLSDEDVVRVTLGER
ncbi:MAG TPA: hypothetical protein VI653_12720, partial [Steroidobacteraceae bacterium]